MIYEHQGGAQHTEGSMGGEGGSTQRGQYRGTLRLSVQEIGGREKLVQSL